MKRIMILLALAGTGLVNAQDIKITSSQGTRQDIIAKLTPAPASPEVDANASIEAKFKEPLNPMMTMRSVRLVKLNKERKKGWFGFRWGKAHIKNQRIQGQVQYDPQTYTLRFIPRKPLEVGFYEIGYRHLMRAKPGPGMRIKPIVYRFYVPEVINGFKLPPEPDEKKNNETLLGIDFNRNGIRDDVERWIITHYANDPKYPKTKTAIALQYAKASQYIISHDPEHAYENKTFEIFDRAMDCEWYWIDRITENNESLFDMISAEYLLLNRTIKAKMFNTEERTKAYWQFNGSLSGHMLGGGGGVMSSTRDKCDIDIDTLGEI